MDIDEKIAAKRAEPETMKNESIETVEQKKIYPRQQPIGKDGWTIDYTFIDSIVKELQNRNGNEWDVGYEQVQDVLLAVESILIGERIGRPVETREGTYILTEA
jgi:hypothetical protein